MTSGWAALRQGLRGPTAPPPPSRPERRGEDGRGFRPAWAEVNLDALRHNARVLATIGAPGALCAVVKANAYGHGALSAARQALAAGAAGVAVALVEEGVELRQGGVSGPILVLSEPPPDAVEAAVAAGLTLTLDTPGGVARAGEAARMLGTRLQVHVKVDTGMHRVGAHPEAAPALAALVAADPALALEGLWTHLTVADGGSAEDRAFTEAQLARFAQVAEAVRAAGGRPTLLHAANSAGAIAWPAARLDMVRCGIALYGYAPGAVVATAFEALGAPALRPVLSLKARVVAVRDLEAGARPSYGRLRALATAGRVATVPIGYADGVARRLFDAGAEVLVGGRRRPLAGAVTMDQIVVDCGPGGDVAVGDEVVLLGRQGAEEVTAAEWAARLGTISYEVLCAIGPRIPRVETGDPR